MAVPRNELASILDKKLQTTFQTYANGLISRNASVFALSKSFIEGMSPVHHSALMSHDAGCLEVPLMILQKIQLAAMM